MDIVPAGASSEISKTADHTPTGEERVLLRSLVHFCRSQRLLQFIKFCIVGVVGLLVDMGILYLLADPRTLGVNVTLSKICGAEIAMLNNFLWNEFWTFRQHKPSIVSPME